jgi:hypothetical protein
LSEIGNGLLSFPIFPLIVVLEIHRESILRDFTRRKISHSGSLARIYLAKEIR